MKFSDKGAPPRPSDQLKGLDVGVIYGLKEAIQLNAPS